LVIDLEIFNCLIYVDFQKDNKIIVLQQRFWGCKDTLFNGKKQEKLRFFDFFYIYLVATKTVPNLILHFLLSQQKKTKQKKNALLK